MTALDGYINAAEIPALILGETATLQSRVVAAEVAAATPSSMEVLLRFPVPGSGSRPHWRQIDRLDICPK